MIVGIDNITPGTSTSSSLSLGSMRPYLQDLIHGLPGLFPHWHFKVFTPPWNEPFSVKHSNVEVVLCPGASRSRVKRVWFEQVKLPGIIAVGKTDIWLGTCNVLPLFAKCRKLLLVQSHQFFTNPETFSPSRRKYLQWAVAQSVRRADFTGVQSEYAKRTLLKYVPMAEDRVGVIYNRPVEFSEAEPGSPGADEAEVTRLTGSKRPYIVYVSGLYPFKNHVRLIETFSRIRTMFPDLALVLAGGAAESRHADDLRALAARHGISDDVIFCGRVSQASIPLLYRNARASVFPSLEETFGLPVLESMSFDCPVVTSNRSSMPEIAGGAAILVDPCDTGSIASGLVQALTDEDLRRDLILKGRERCRVFTKERTVATIAAALRGIVPAATDLDVAA